MSDTPKNWVMALVSGRGSFAAFTKTRQHPLQYSLAICTNPVEFLLAERKPSGISCGISLPVLTPT